MRVAVVVAHGGLEMKRQRAIEARDSTARPPGKVIP